MARGRWEEVRTLKTAATQPWTPRNLQRCDPYLVWADAVTPSAVSKSRLDISVLVELTSTSDYPAFLDRLNKGMRERRRGFRFVPNGFEPRGSTRFVTGLVNRQGLAELIKDVVNGRIERFSLQESRLDMAERAEDGWKRYVAKAKGAGAMAAPSLRLAASAGTYLGIVDDGLPVLRARQATQTGGQAIHFWDQGWLSAEAMAQGIDAPSRHDPDWDVPWGRRAGPSAPGTFFKARGFLYGRVLKLRPRTPATRGDSADAYRLIRYYSPVPRRSHGAAVLGLLAPWLSAARGPAHWPSHISGLAMVQLPTSTVMDTSGGSLAMRVLDGLRYILWREEQDRPDNAPARPVLANVSYGVHAGPHDGTSMFERALLEMLDDNPHLHVVLPAGNGAQAGCHAQRTLASSGESTDSAVFLLHVLPDNNHDSFVELWIPAGGSISIDIRPPGSEAVYSVRQGEARIHFVPEPADPAVPGRIHFGAIYPGSVAQGTDGAMALVAIGCTGRPARERNSARVLGRQRRLEVAGQPGLWALTVRNLASSPVTVDAWIERGDAPPDASAGGRQAYFPDSCDERIRTGNSTPTGTLNGIATLKHERLHVVGAMRADGALADYSAAGLARPGGGTPAKQADAGCGPEVVTTADTSRNLPGIKTIGFLHGAIDRINGTSAACAVYARALALQLAGEAGEPPAADEPGEVPPEVSCVAESQPQADPALRGQAERRALPFEVDL
jgi:hypothetical protein